MVGNLARSVGIWLKQLDGVPAHLQGMLRGNGDVHLWIRRSWRSISDAPFDLCTYHGMGHLCGWDNGDHCRDLCVPRFFISPNED